MVSLWVAVFAGMGLGILVLPARAADVPLSGAIPSTVYEIELTYIGERTDPTVAFSGPPPTAAPLPYRPFLPILELHTSLGRSGPSVLAVLRRRSRTSVSSSNGVPAEQPVVGSVSSYIQPGSQ